MYKTVKTQGKIVYIRCTDSTNLLKNLNSLNEKTVNNFLNSEQKIILCKIVEIVYTENNEQFL